MHAFYKFLDEQPVPGSQFVGTGRIDRNERGIGRVIGRVESLLPTSPAFSTIPTKEEFGTGYRT